MAWSVRPSPQGESRPLVVYCRVFDSTLLVFVLFPQESIKGVQEEIGALKEGLVVERKKRHNKEVYEETCKDINKYPPHLATKASNHSTLHSGFRVALALCLLYRSLPPLGCEGGCLLHLLVNSPRCCQRGLFLFLWLTSPPCCKVNGGCSGLRVRVEAWFCFAVYLALFAYSTVVVCFLSKKPGILLSYLI